VFLTNNVRWSPEDFVRKLWRLGVRAAVNEVVSAGAAVQHLLAESNDGGAAFVIGSQALVDHVATAGMRIVNNTPFAARADVVVVGGHDGFDYRELRIATQAIARGAELIGTNRDPSFPMPDGPWPGTGAVLAAVETATGRRADRMVGKPEVAMYETALDRLGPGRALAVGDRLETDVAGARAAGIDVALVLTGGATREQAEAAGAPVDAHRGVARERPRVTSACTRSGHKLSAVEPRAVAAPVRLAEALLRIGRPQSSRLTWWGLRRRPPLGGLLGRPASRTGRAWCPPLPASFSTSNRAHRIARRRLGELVLLAAALLLVRLDVTLRDECCAATSRP
jgi:HAD superfamily hydrolase (TIGR01450 family)